MISRMLGKYVDNGRNTNYIKAHPLKKNPISSFGSIVLTFRKVFIKRQPSIKSYLIKFLSILLFSKECFIVTTITNSVLLSLLFGDFPWKCSLDGDVVRLEVSNPLIPNGAFSIDGTWKAFGEVYWRHDVFHVKQCLMMVILLCTTT